MEDAGSAVCGLAAERELLVVVAVEARAEGDELADRLRAFSREKLDHVGVGQPARDRDGVGGVERGRIVGPDRGRDPALGPRARTSRPEAGLGDHVDAKRGQGERRRHAGHSGADDHHVGHEKIVGAGRHRTLVARTASMRSTACRARPATAGSIFTSNFKSRSDS